MARSPKKRPGQERFAWKAAASDAEGGDEARDGAGGETEGELAGDPPRPHSASISLPAWLRPSHTLYPPAAPRPFVPSQLTHIDTRVFKDLTEEERLRLILGSGRARRRAAPRLQTLAAARRHSPLPALPKLRKFATEGNRA